jgi:hypothetical protein
MNNLVNYFGLVIIGNESYELSYILEIKIINN